MKLKILNILVILLIFSIVTGLLIEKKGLYSQKFNPQKLDLLYSQSQFAQNPQDRKLIIQDEDLYAYSGYHYLKTGELDKINIEHPPLGKYFIGLSIWIFNNQNIGQIFWAILFLILLYKLSNNIIKHSALSLLVVFLFSLEKLFIDQLTHSDLDIILGVFLLIFMLTAIGQSKSNNKTILIQGLSLGAIASIKYPTIGLLCFFTLTIYYLIIKKKFLIKKLTIIGIISLMIFLFSYLPFFIKNPQPLSFYHLQLKALKIHLSHVPEYPKFQVFNVLFFDKWLSWWGNKNYLSTGFWNILWPILIINFFLTLCLKIKKNLLIIIWILLYLSFLSLRLFFARYLFILLPFLYIQLGISLKEINFKRFFGKLP